MTEQSPKCLGIWGRLFGHSFKISVDVVFVLLDSCKRCGFTPTKKGTPE